MKIVQTKTPEDFEKITRVELFKLCFGSKLSDAPLTNGQIATMYGVTKKEVKQKKKELKLGWLQCGIIFVMGGPRYK